MEDAEQYNPAKFRRKLEAKGALRDCPACGKNDWGSPDDGVFSVSGTVSERGIDGRVTATMECAPIICNHCDLVRFHVLGLY